MPIASLPQELVDQIIDHLHDDPSTLKACALVCRAWLSPCRAHIFRDITLEGKLDMRGIMSWFRGTPHIPRLHAILASTPEIVAAVRGVVVREGMVNRHWIVQEKMLVPILELLRNVERFHLERAAAVQIAWGELPGELRGAVGKVLGLPSLRELRLGMLTLADPRDFLRILEGCRSLRLLHVDHLRLGGPMPGGDGSLDTGVTRARLDALVIGMRTSPHIVSCLLHPRFTIDIGTLRRLSVSISGDFGEFARLLRATVALESLELVLMSDVDLAAYHDLPSSDRFDMSHNPHLRSLDVKIDVIQRQDDPLPWLNTALFSTFTTPNALERIHVVYSLYLPEPYMDRSMNTTIFSRWEDVDATLAGPVFAGGALGLGSGSGLGEGLVEGEGLRQVRLEFALENPIGYGVAPRFLREVELRSPELRKRGILVVEAFDTSG